MKLPTFVADLSIPLRFNGEQPNAFGVDRASASSLGDTRTGSSVNFDSVTLVPHCNGTHTECVGHITNERISVRSCLKDVLMRALLVSVKPITLENGDRVIDAEQLKIAGLESRAGVSALIVRTLPNDDSKLSRVYGAENIPAYFTSAAMKHVVSCGVKHLLVDLPSIDRLADGGRLLSHRVFWNVEPGSFAVNENSRINATITELIYVPNEVADGEYLLNLQIAPFDSDAAPSRPVLLSDGVFESGL